MPKKPEILPGSLEVADSQEHVIVRAALYGFTPVEFPNGEPLPDPDELECYPYTIEGDLAKRVLGAIEDFAREGELGFEPNYEKNWPKKPEQRLLFAAASKYVEQQHRTQLP